ncbi:hypothetical protein [Myroides odoratus]|uniref:Uncharacterized protein n=1 Tax=Myroides odoratus TaxID=256 RepID=A0A9Q6ZFF5_MYROD|nr:hypothetical protein [Myroides odoratus]EHQ41786.1 hypothetical protein Myrod_0951 [Myroides odoratus DSM 2801]EKB08985.1 hypothetical protein HMPREF9716_00492 [Myroides odoratus CIP 103059]QQT99188.1 hypothetical protein I6I88_13335 [Myroides odoratus]WQD58614.1 hypothetical protein U0010_05625 [Myroides odoratus]STZ29047.1 Uncharacterised protein [Myroides odoratus]
MDENNRIQEVVKEYILEVDDLDISIRARIVKILNLGTEIIHPYEWQISHYCKQTETAGTTYTPSNMHADTLESCEIQLIGYLKSFRNIGVIENGYY